ncbi:MAG: hypothetical protein GF346_04395 [Candidatus Eisenbacteria bacterium]|nr:hypothetical protein [Candidatus Latescibacterota bacterium]MBD3301667.1 hypothetical protein [Candidatus Eisenbacteria bacterium]
MRISIVVAVLAAVVLGSFIAEAGIAGGRLSLPQPRWDAPRPLFASSDGDEDEGPPLVEVSGSFAFQAIYDDNILRYPGNWIEDFRRNDPPEKFEVETHDDLILSPRLFLRFDSNRLAARETRLYFGYITWQYTQNSIKNNDLWLFRLRQYTARRDYLEASYSFSPPSYIKALSDREPFQSRATTPLEWKGFKGVRHGIALGYSKRMWGNYDFWFEGERVLRFYNRPFMENDNKEWNGSFQVTWNNWDDWRIRAKYQYSDATSRAIDTVGETRETSDDGDGSYERDLYELRIRHRPDGLWPFKEFEIKGQYMGYYFTNKRPVWEDPLHSGRQDDVYYLELTSGSETLFDSYSFELGYRYAQRTSSLPGTFEGEDAEDKDYENNRAWVELRYSF